ncbi:BatA domain-containing protein [Maribacter sp. HTCC2170]|uniref:BatA domain-containing protein n=1 Tax=Maribacter sp. (strain HTCC2170 / KCCM 42371) TaxID=313603 RepID=UPI00006B2200|nr:BatA domain-containing protein [Maribacter sp. HTCC2170]EAR00263.1 hypothetical protein FB2170_12616 [Maribacter sp. HTCC2170]
MQFKYPELLWALFLLLIPIFIHLFQLRRFKKTPFTNVKLLKKVVAESRKSNSLKKWLLLFTRLLVFTFVIVAFAQPFFAKKNAMQPKETVIYLDNSFSMQAKSKQGTLLDNAVQELLKNVPSDKSFSLFTNTTEYRNVQLANIQNELLKLKPTSQQLDFEEIQLKGHTFFSKDDSSIKNLVLISDFQQRSAPLSIKNENVKNHLVKLTADELPNITIDTCYISRNGTENIEITAQLSASSSIQATPISLYNSDKLIAKSSALFKNNKGEIIFTVGANEVINGKIEITDNQLGYDNLLYFNIDEKEKPHILVIGDSSSEYLKKIYTEDEFVFSLYSLKNLNYRNLETQNLIVLNEIKNIPSSLIASLSSFVEDGGNLVIIPSINAQMDNYNQLLSRLAIGSFIEQTNTMSNITQIAFSHPLYENVFEKNINNFQYPKVSQFFKLRSNSASILRFQNGDPFLVGTNRIYLFSSSLDLQNSNFKQSPLIVPTFYKMGVNSLKSTELYHTMSSLAVVDIVKKMTKDHILKVTKEDIEFIPQQRNHANKVSLTFNDNPTEDGIYGISENGTSIRNISFNYPRKESNLVYDDLSELPTINKQDSITNLFQELENSDSISELWKWFVILAALFILIEVLIIKYLK